jgi:hypothetical protein
MRMRSSLVSSWGLVLVLGVAAAGCGSVAASSDGSTGSDGGLDMAPPTVDEACAQFATAFCGRLQACAPFVGQVLYGDRTMCESRAALGCMLDFEVSDTNHTTTDMVTCAHDASNATCEDLLANNLPTSCQIKPGLRLAGQGCGSSWQCMSTHCEKSNGDCGVCAPRAAAGGACTVDEGCNLGLVCAAQRCVAPGALNASCGDAAPCRGGLYCSASSKMCATPLGAGASCENDSNACDFAKGVGCNGFASPPTCQAVSSARGGEACGIVNSTLTICIVLNSCNGISLVPLQTMGTCPNPAGDGQACDDKVHCMAPASCVGGLCRLPSSASCSK